MRREHADSEGTGGGNSTRGGNKTHFGVRAASHFHNKIRSFVEARQMIKALQMIYSFTPFARSLNKAIQPTNGKSDRPGNGSAQPAFRL